MSKTLGPVLAMGAVTMVNQSVFHDKPVDWRVPMATGLAGIGFGLVERVWPEGAEILAWTALATVLLTRTDPKIPSPTESAVSWFDQQKGA
jgi:hypothetical protein